MFPKFNPSSLLNSGLNLKFDFFLNVKFIKLGLLKILCKYLTFSQSYAQKTFDGVDSTPPPSPLDQEGLTFDACSDTGVTFLVETKSFALSDLFTNMKKRYKK